MRAKEKNNFVKVGFFITSLMVVVMVFVVSMGKESALFESKAIVRAQVKNADKLKTGAVVELKGLRIGFVDEVKIISHDTVEIVMSVRGQDVKWIMKDSKVAISNAGLVGDKYLEITAGSAAAGSFNPEKEFRYGEESMDFKAMAAKGTEIANSTERIMSKIDLLLDQVDAKKIQTAVDGFSKTATHMAPAVEKMDKAMGNLTSSLQRLDGILARVQSGPGSAHGLIYDDGVHEDLRKLLGGAERNTVIKYFIRESIKKAPKKSE
mgnify:CR=1 FL=1